MKLIAALTKIITTSDFKTAKVKFISQGIDKEVVDSYFKLFKECRDQNKIKKTEDKNIDAWANKSWEVFTKFVDGLQTTFTKTQERKTPWKQPVPEGAEKVAENAEWVIYHIDSFKASKALGTRNWCVSRNEHDWYDYTEIDENYPDQEQYTFYFALSKTRSYQIKNINESTDITHGSHIEYDDVWHRIAIQVDWNEQNEYWNANDSSFSSLPKDIKLPEFKRKIPDFPLSLNTPKKGQGICNNCDKPLSECTCCVDCGDPTSGCSCGY